MEDNNNVQSLLNQENEQTSLLDNNEEQENSLLGGDNVQTSQDGGSLLSADDNMSFVDLNNDALSEAQIEARKKYFSDPKVQAEILLQNYIKSSPILVNHQQRRAIYRQYYKDAKKGKFKKLFYESIYGISKDEAQGKISKLND